MIGKQFVRVGIEFGYFPPDARLFEQIAITNFWTIVEIQPSSAILILPVTGSSKRAAPYKARKIVSSQFKDIPAAEVVFALIEEIPTSSKNRFDVKTRMKIPGWSRPIFGNWLESRGLFFDSPRSSDVNELVRDGQIRNNLSRNGVKNSWQLNLYPKYSLITSESDSKSSSFSASGAGAALLMLQILVGIGAAFPVALLFERITRVNVLIVAIALGAMIALARRIDRLAADDWGLAQRVFLVAYPFLIGALICALSLTVSISDTLWSVLFTIGVLLYCFVGIGSIFTLEMERVRKLFLQTSLILGLVVSVFPLYSEYYTEEFLREFGIPASVVDIPGSEVFELSLAPVLLIFVAAFLCLSLYGWLSFLFGFVEPNRASVIQAIVAFCLVCLCCLAASLGLSHKAAKVVIEEPRNGRSYMEHFGVEFYKVCASSVGTGAAEQFASLNESTPYWYVPTNDGEFWLYQVASTSGKSFDALVMVSKSDFQLRQLEEGYGTC